MLERLRSCTLAVAVVLATAAGCQGFETAEAPEPENGAWSGEQSVGTGPETSGLLSHKDPSKVGRGLDQLGVPDARGRRRLEGKDEASVVEPGDASTTGQNNSPIPGAAAVRRRM